MEWNGREDDGSLLFQLHIFGHVGTRAQCKKIKFESLWLIGLFALLLPSFTLNHLSVVMVNFRCQIGRATVPKYLTTHGPRCFCEGVF